VSLETGVAQALRAGLDAEPGGTRRAALLVHAMAPADRAFILDALPEAQRTTLRGLLEELEALGIARDPAWVADATGHAVHAPRGPLSDEERLRALDEEEMDSMVRLMRAEPAGVVARWLCAGDWPWHDQLLAGLEPGHRRRVEALLPVSASSVPPPAMRAALFAAVSGRLQAPMPERTAPRPGLRHLLARILRLDGASPRAAA
jgi:hypothetical protein